VPKLWKAASILPLPKIPSSLAPSDYRPTSIAQFSPDCWNALYHLLYLPILSVQFTRRLRTILLLICSFIHTVQKQQRTLNEDYQNIKCVQVTMWRVHYECHLVVQKTEKKNPVPAATLSTFYTS